LQTFPYAQETHLVRTGKITYKQALHAICDRRNALSKALPFSARILGQGNSFLYRQGVICVLAGDIVRVADVRSTLDTVRLELTAIIQPVLESTFASFGNFKVSLLYYSDGVLAIYIESESRPNLGYIFAISTAEIWTGSRVIMARQVTASSKLFVRHTARYLYYGTHTGIGDDGHHKWEISGISLDERFPLPTSERPLLFEDFHGTDIGSTVAFEIYNDHFYAVSNQGTFEVEEVDWTSFYHCIRFPVDNPVSAAMLKDERVYRRQHAQGPIHDSWTDLSLQLSERTNEVMILESRREWAQASSRQSRTFYTSKFHVNLKQSSRASSPSEDVPENVLLPEDDLFVDVLDSSNKPNWMPTPAQHGWSRHPEFTVQDPSPRSFILAKTKFRAYNYSCSAFLDLVEDERCCNSPTAPASSCLRLRVGSRHETSLNMPPLNINVKGKGRASNALPVFADHVQYRNSPIRMWPPPASTCPCSARLHDILNPLDASLSRTVTGVLDERTLVYMVKPGRSYGASDENVLGSIVVIDFTRPMADTMHVPMARCDSKMDTDNHDDAEVADDFDAKHWQWTVGQKTRCQKGTCR
jgi:hypothetical protein